MSLVVADALRRAAGLETVHLRHDDVEQDEIGPQAGDQIERLPAAGGDADLVALVFERGGEHLDVGRCVIHHQNAAVHGSECAAHALGAREQE